MKNHIGVLAALTLLACSHTETSPPRSATTGGPLGPAGQPTPNVVKLDGTPGHLRVEGNTVYVLVKSADSKVLVIIDLSERRVTRRIPVSARSIYFEVSDGRIYIAAREDGVHIVNLSTGEIERRIETKNAANYVFRFGEHLAVESAAGLELYELDSGRRVAVVELEGITAGLQRVGSSVFVSHSYPGGLQIVDLVKRRVTKAIQTLDWLVSLKIVGSRAYCESETKRGTYLVFDVDRMVVVGRLTAGRHCDFDARHAYFAGDDKLTITDLASEKVVASIEVAGAKRAFVAGHSVFVLTETSVRILKKGDLLPPN